MSLDVSLISDTPVVKRGTGVFVRDGGKTRELSYEEVMERYPKHKINQTEYESSELFTANCTHNLGDMAADSGIYKHLWRPEEIGISKAKELIDPLREGLHLLKMEPKRFKKLNPENGWGTYEGFVSFVESYLSACYEYPEATIEVSR